MDKLDFEIKELLCELAPTFVPIIQMDEWAVIYKIQQICHAIDEINERLNSMELVQESLCG